MQKLTRAYVRHLLKANEVLGIRLTTWHNLAFLGKLMQDIRTAIAEDRFDEFGARFCGSTRQPAERLRVTIRHN